MTNNKRIAVFPGSFNPFTIGHLDIIKKALPLFDEIIIAIGKNSTKKSQLKTEDNNLEQIKKAIAPYPSVSVEQYNGLTVDFCQKHQARFILRGIRNTIDFEYEKPIAQMNRKMDNNILTVFLTTDEQYNAISSTIIRELSENEKDVTEFLP